MKSKILYLLLFTAFISACKKETNVTLKEGPITGSFKYKLIDDKGAGIAGVKLSVYRKTPGSIYYYPDHGNLAGQTTTDMAGTGNFSELQPDNYLLVADSVNLEGENYKIEDYLQITSGITKERERKATDFTGYVQVKLQSNLDYSTPLSNVGVAFINDNPDHINDAQLIAALNASSLKGITDANGMAKIRLPAGTSYYLLVFSMANNALIAKFSYPYWLVKDRVQIATEYANPFYK